MKFTKKERELEVISLESFGLTSEEIEGYFDFYEDIWALERPKRRKIMIINSKKKVDSQ
jgi:hypothetical protein